MISILRRLRLSVGLTFNGEASHTLGLRGQSVLRALLLPLIMYAIKRVKSHGHPLRKKIGHAMLSSGLGIMMGTLLELCG
jgi:hypothetical protein